MRLIDADALRKEIRELPNETTDYSYLDLVDREVVQALISEAPTVERPHGEWISHYEYCKKHDFIPSGLITFWWCNQCEQGVEIQTNFCPNCGSDMREGR